MYEATAKGTAEGRRQAQPQITASSPKVATNSLNTCAGRTERSNHLSAEVERHLVPREPAL
jgi:hypothetical protein